MLYQVAGSRFNLGNEEASGVPRQLHVKLNDAMRKMGGS